MSDSMLKQWVDASMKNVKTFTMKNEMRDRLRLMMIFFQKLKIILLTTNSQL